MSKNERENNTQDNDTNSEDTFATVTVRSMSQDAWLLAKIECAKRQITLGAYIESVIRKDVSRQ